MQTGQNLVRPDWCSQRSGSKMQAAPEAGMGLVVATQVERLEELAEGWAAAVGTAEALEAEAMVAA